MRVSKTVREYIESEVSRRLMPKYAAEKKESIRQVTVKEDILKRAAEAAEDAWNEVISTALALPGMDFIQDCRNSPYGGNKPSFYNSSALYIGHNNMDTVHGYGYRMRQEKERIVRDIIVELELGGTKADLERLLNEIGVEG